MRNEDEKAHSKIVSIDQKIDQINRIKPSNRPRLCADTTVCPHSHGRARVLLKCVGVGMCVHVYVFVCVCWCNFAGPAFVCIRESIFHMHTHTTDQIYI